jgi:DNA helicase HerA-like ATPase
MLDDAIRQALDNGDRPGQPNKSKIGLRELAKTLVSRLTEGEFRLPYLNPKAENGKRNLDELPLVSVVVEEAPSVLNPARMKFGSVFRDISRQGRKFRVGLTVVSQQVTEIDAGILSQINTQLILALGSDAERREAIKIASADLSGFQRELQVMDTGQLIFSASYKQLPLPVKVPNFDTL